MEKLIFDGNRYFNWCSRSPDHRIQIPLEAFYEYRFHPGPEGIASRGRRMAFSLVELGPIIDQAIKYPQVQVYQA